LAVPVPGRAGASDTLTSRISTGAQVLAGGDPRDLAEVGVHVRLIVVAATEGDLGEPGGGRTEQRVEVGRGIAQLVQRMGEQCPCAGRVEADAENAAAGRRCLDHERAREDAGNARGP
jgi:hypothetical protein